MDVELLVIPDCPNSEGAAALLRDALDAVGLEEQTFSLGVISSDRQAQARGFHGSPTFMVDGQDLFTTTGEPSLACRVYATSRGLRGLPEPGEVRQALATAARQPRR